VPDRNKVLTVISEWVIKAENDLTTAAHTLKLGGGTARPTRFASMPNSASRSI
jgi:hypothetical protein